MKIVKMMLVVLVALQLSGCLLTKIITVPMRVTGAALSIIPGPGNTVHDVIDKAADVVDDVPI